MSVAFTNRSVENSGAFPCADILALPKNLRAAGWKVKIQEKETTEPPHVSILRGPCKWRLNLRDRQFMDTSPASSLVPSGLLATIHDNWDWLCNQWNHKYPNNPV